MKKRSFTGAPAALLAVALVLAALLVPQLARTAYPAGSTPTPTPLAICGTIGTFTANSATATGLISINTVSGTPNYTIAAGATITNSLQGTVTGSSVCLVGGLDATGQLTSFTLTPNVPFTVTLCGNVAAYTAASTNGVGSLTVGSSILPVAQNTTFTGGTAITTGSNLCIQATLNGLGQVVAGVVTANTAGTASTGAPVAICGTVASYTAATSTTAGTLQFTLATVNVTYTIPANTTINGSLSSAIATGQNICLSGIVTGSNALSSVTLTANATTMLTECGAVGTFVAPSGTTPGSLSLGSSVLPVSPNATFSGAPLTSGASLCLAITLNGLGQVASATASATTPTTTATTVTATVVVTPTITSTPSIQPPPPPSQATNTPTATSTVVPTATSTPVPTDTPTATATATTAPTTTPTPKRRAIAQFKYISVWYNVIRIGTVEHLVVQAGARQFQHIEVHVFFATGRRYDFSERTNRQGLWTKVFQIPPYTISGYSREAVITFQLFKNHTTSRDYRFFYVVH